MTLTRGRLLVVSWRRGCASSVGDPSQTFLHALERLGEACFGFGRRRVFFGWRWQRFVAPWIPNGVGVRLIVQQFGRIVECLERLLHLFLPVEPDLVATGCLWTGRFAGMWSRPSWAPRMGPVNRHPKLALRGPW